MPGNGTGAHVDVAVHKLAQHARVKTEVVRSGDNVPDGCICYPHFMVGNRLPLIFILEYSIRFILIGDTFGVSPGNARASKSRWNEVMRVA